MEKQIYFLKKAFIQTKDWDSFLFFLSYVKDLNADDKLELFKNIIEHISINSINDNENLICKLTDFFGNIFYENETYYKIFRDEIFKQFSETSNQKIDNLFSIYLSKLSNGVLEKILLKDEIVYKLINKKLTNSLNIFMNKDLYIFLNENNINAIKDSLWLEYIKNTGNTFLEAKSDDIVYKKAWQKLYMNGDDSIKNIILQNIKNEEVKILETDHYFLKIEKEIKESNFTKNIEDISNSKETSFEILKNSKDSKGRNFLFFTLNLNDTFINEVYDKPEYQKQITDTDNKGRSIIPYCFMCENISKKSLKYITENIIFENNRGVFEQIIGLKRENKQCNFKFHQTILNKLSDENLLGNSQNLIYKLIQIAKLKRKELIPFLPIFRKLRNADNHIFKKIWLLTEIESDILGDKNNIEKLIYEGVFIEKELLNVDFIDILKSKTFDNFDSSFIDRIYTTSQENMLLNNLDINYSEKGSNKVLNRI